MSNKPLLYAFGGLPVALLGLLIALGHDRRQSEPVEPAVAARAEEETSTIPAPPAATEREGTATITAITPPPVNGAASQRGVAPWPREDRSPVVAESGQNPPADDPAGTTAPRIDPPAQKDSGATEKPAEPPIFGADSVEVAANTPAAEPEIENGRVVVQPGNTLWRLSRVIYGKGRDYVVLAESNRGTISDPDMIYPGQVIVVPGAVPPENIDPRRKRPLRADEGRPSVVE